MNGNSNQLAATLGVSNNNTMTRANNRQLPVSNKQEPGKKEVQNGLFAFS